MHAWAAVHVACVLVLTATTFPTTCAPPPHSLDGKTDRYRMQVYALAVSEESAATEEEEEAADSEAANAGGNMTPRAPPLLLGALSVLNYPKTYKTPLNESFAPFVAQCAALRGGQPLCDTLDVHLASSRDGIHCEQPAAAVSPRCRTIGGRWKAATPSLTHQIGLRAGLHRGCGLGLCSAATRVTRAKTRGRRERDDPAVRRALGAWRRDDAHLCSNSFPA